MQAIPTTFAMKEVVAMFLRFVICIGLSSLVVISAMFPAFSVRSTRGRSASVDIYVDGMMAVQHRKASLLVFYLRGGE